MNTRQPIYLSDTDISALLDYQGVAAVLDASLADLAAGKAAVHARQRTDNQNLRLSTMGAVWSAKQVAGVKAYPTVNGGFSFLVTLFDLEANRPIAVLEGAELTKFRTAAMTALVASKCMPGRLSKLALFGAGFQGRAQAEALCASFHFDQICVVDPLAGMGWCNHLALQTGSRVNLCDPETAVRSADIVVTATRSQTPVFDGHWLKPGAFVSAMGISAPKGRELDDATLTRAQRIIVEWKPQSVAEAGELVLWNAGSASEREKIVDLPEMYRHGAPWRESDQDIVVFKSVGIGLADVACAYLAYSRSQSAQTALSLEPPV